MCQSLAHFFITGVTTKAPSALTAIEIPVNWATSPIVQQRGWFISNRFNSGKSNVGNKEMKNAAIRMFSRTRDCLGDRNNENRCRTSSHSVRICRSTRGSADSERGSGLSQFRECDKSTTLSSERGSVWGKRGIRRWHPVAVVYPVVFSHSSSVSDWPTPDWSLTTTCSWSSSRRKKKT